MDLRSMNAVRIPRVLAGGMAAGLFAATVAVGMREDASGWLALGFAVMPDLSMLAGIGQPVEKGRMPSRAVPVYNALHSLLGRWRCWRPYSRSDGALRGSGRRWPGPPTSWSTGQLATACGRPKATSGPPRSG